MNSKISIGIWLFFAFLGVTPLFALPDLPEVKSESNQRQKGQRDDDSPRRRQDDDDRNSYGFNNMGQEFKKFGEEVAHRIDRIVKKKSFQFWGDPWTIQGIPLIFPSPNNGFHLGLHTKVNNIRREDPHKVELMAQVLATDRGRYKHFFQIDLPYAFDGGYRFTSRVSYNRDISFRYYGIGNETKVNQAAIDQDLPLYQSIRSGPSLNVSFLKYFGRSVRLGPIAGFKWTDIQAPTGSLLLSERPSGIAGGNTHYIGLAIIHDSLDFEPYPTRGGYHELYLALYQGFMGSHYDFLRSTYTYRRFERLHSKLIFAHRTLVENLAGNAPFYELNAVGGSDNTIGFGGDRFMRGYDGNRFIDKIRTVLGFELRWDPIHFDFAGQDLYLGFVPFVDIGRVWDRMLPFQLGKWHASTGWGARIIWNRRLILRTDFAINQEGTHFYVELGNSF